MPAGGELMLKHGIDIRKSSGSALEAELLKDVDVDRTIPGFEDFISDRAAGVTPGHVAGSLLYHAFAAPTVTRVPTDGPGIPGLTAELTEFPTLEELDALENYIFAKATRSLNDVRNLAGSLLGVPSDLVELSAAVFAIEYRSAPATAHRRYADLCLSRTGVARVGTISAQYDGRLRGYLPFREGDAPNAIRALPCRYSTWIAARSIARADRFGPAGDGSRDPNEQYQVPLHKLFNGTECLTGTDLSISLQTRHQNRKIERIHAHMDEKGVPAGFTPEQRRNPPFVKEHGLADWLETYPGGGRLLGPTPQPLVERTSFENQHLSFESPPMGGQFSDAFSPTFSLDVPGRTDSSVAGIRTRSFCCNRRKRRLFWKSGQCGSDRHNGRVSGPQSVGLNG